MTIKLSFPTAASPSAEVTLPDVENWPRARPVRRLQSVFDTDAGEQVVYEWGAAQRSFVVTLYPLDATQAAALETFFNDTANGRANAWEFTDSRGTLYAVRFAQDVFEVAEQFYGRFRLLMTLRVID